MKVTLIIVIILCSFNVFAGRAMILVLEAPIFKNPTFDSKIIQHVNRGEIIFVHDKHFELPPYDLAFRSQKIRSYLDDQTYDTSSFYETLDKNGNTAYVPKKFVKVVYNDTRENGESISPYANDPTDYRLHEPLHEKYPLINSNQYRMSFAFGMSPSLKESYEYNSQILHHQYRNLLGLNLTYAKNVAESYGSRIFIGGRLSLNTESAKFRFLGTRGAKETKSSISFGPYISFDSFRNTFYLISIFSSVQARYHITKVYQSEYKTMGTTASGTTISDEASDEAVFRGFSFEGTFGATVKRKIFSNIYAFLGPELFITSPHSLSNKDAHTNRTFWDNDYSTYQSFFNTNYRFILGIMGSY